MTFSLHLGRRVRGLTCSSNRRVPWAVFISRRLCESLTIELSLYVFSAVAVLSADTPLRVDAMDPN